MKQLYIFISLIFIVAQIPLSGFERHELVKVLEKIAETHRKISREISEWNQEKETLTLELSLLKSSIKDFTGNQDELVKEINKLKEKKIKLQSILTELGKHQRNINNFLNENGKFLITAGKQIPPSLQFIIKNDLDKLKALLAEDVQNPADKLSVISSLTSSILKVQKEVHRVKEVLTVNDQLLELEVIYLGTYTGYFKNSGKDLFGRVSMNGNKWQAVPDNSLKASIIDLFDQFDHKGTPRLIKLPVGEPQ